MFLKSLKISRERTCVGVFFNKVAGSQNCNFTKKRLQHRYFPVNFVNCSKIPICVENVWTHWCAFIRTSFLAEHFLWLLLTVSGFQPAALIEKGVQQRRFSVRFAKFVKNIFLQNTSGWLLLVFTCNFEKFFRSPIFLRTSGKQLISYTS